MELPLYLNEAEPQLIGGPQLLLYKGFQNSASIYAARTVKHRANVRKV